MKSHTLDIRDGISEDFSLRLFVLEASQDFCNNGFGQLSLLAFLLLLLIADPAIKDRFKLARQCDFLTLNKSFILQLSSLLTNQKCLQIGPDVSPQGTS